jgi:hypothetical protein
VFLYTRIPVIQYDINMNEMVRYNSIKAAANVFGVDQARIRDVVSGRRKSFRGYIFRELILGSCKKVKNIENPIKVRQYDINNNLINQFTTYAEAARSIKRNKKTLMNTLDGKQKTCAGYLFKYA